LVRPPGSCGAELLPLHPDALEFSIERLKLGPQLGDPRLDVEPFPSPKARGQRPD
jgi:hypothetical protein